MSHDLAKPDRPRTLQEVAGADELNLDEFETPPPWTPRAGRKGSGEKFAAGMRGLKYAIRGDSSFFAHGYRGLLIALTASQLSVDTLGWCLLIISACLVLLAELTHSAVDTLARAAGDPEAPPLKMAREIAAGGVVVAAIASGFLTGIVLVVKFGELFGWWARHAPPTP